MSLVRFKDLVIDANDVAAMTAFWARALSLTVKHLDDDEGVLVGESPHQTVFVCGVPESRSAKNRVHLDLAAPSLDLFADCEPVGDTSEFAWTTLADPEGGEFCVFVMDEVSEPRLKDIVVDAVNPTHIAAWWHKIWGGTLVHDHGYSYIDDVPGAPLESIDFVPVPEPKAGKNRVHWDVTLTSGHTVHDLVAAGASVLAPPRDGIPWTVMADPEGNEFCAFPPS